MDQKQKPTPGKRQTLVINPSIHHNRVSELKQTFTTYWLKQNNDKVTIINRV